MKQTYIYFVEAVGCRRIKIGHSASLESRLDQIVTSSPFPIQVVALIKCNSEDVRSIEHEIRSQFFIEHGNDAHLEWVQVSEEKPSSVVIDFLNSRMLPNGKLRFTERTCELLNSLGFEPQHWECVLLGACAIGSEASHWRAGDVAKKVINLPIYYDPKRIANAGIAMPIGLS